MIIGKRKLLAALVAIGFHGLFISQANAESAAYIGRDGWLFYQYEHSDEKDVKAIETSVALYADFIKEMEKRGTQVYVTLVPLKIRTYQKYLPKPLDNHLQSSYSKILERFNKSGIKTIDLNSPFMKYAAEAANDASPLYLRQDSHWSSNGALLAAETIAKALQEAPQARSVLDTEPVLPYQVKKRNAMIRSKVRDLVPQLPAGSPEQDVEMILDIRFLPPAQQGSLMGDVFKSVALVGSSYSAGWTGFPGAMRYALQRDIADVSIPALEGSWQGMLKYLNDDAYKKNKPKLLIWEMPERDMIAPPDFKYREQRYLITPQAWLKQAIGLL
jgi:alginate O-acetyltransferase complex protein AlgJ